ncbi:unnamed protein product [Zymoseptoria tritici ST99CH_1A5]|uniref:Uncharacterized protein n=2 Tax=Zymoseptoria tritici TaxID=1047171 RepID=A0A1X7S7Q5_ZYMT9|nr:unnamed protein product [Zymoseptoria tritici ST99CH_3D7]SMR64042.1 unnamed protein product [Zymoseptoria tritici ST99CH_3D1]SMY29393.1 unnamed protein product [Zymoseptoria tritici ST99CH_1A5]
MFGHGNMSEAPPPYEAAMDPERTTTGPKAPSAAPGPHGYEIESAANGILSLQIKQNENVLYYISHYNEVNTPDIILFADYNHKGPRLAQASFNPPGKDFKFYIGGIKSPTGDDWDIVRCAQGRLLSYASYRFETSRKDSKGRTLHGRYY